MRELIYQKLKVLLCEVGPIIGELFEISLDLLEGEYGFEQIKVFHEKNERLKTKAAIIHFLKRIVMFSWLDVAVNIVVIDLLQTVFCLGDWDNIELAILPKLLRPSKLVVDAVFILKDLPLFVFLGFEH